MIDLILLSSVGFPTTYIKKETKPEVNEFGAVVPPAPSEGAEHEEPLFFTQRGLGYLGSKPFLNRQMTTKLRNLKDQEEIYAVREILLGTLLREPSSEKAMNELLNLHGLQDEILGVRVPILFLFG